MKLSSVECEDLAYALNIRICVIETGDPVLTAADAISMNKSHLIKPLTEDQQRLILRLKDLRTKVLRSGSSLGQL